MFKLRILYFYEFCLFISSFSFQLRLTLYCQNLVVRFVIFVGCLIIPFLFLIKCYAVTTTTTATGELCATWEPRGTTISNFSAVFMCVFVIFFCLLSCHISAQKGTIFDKIFVCLLFSVYSFFFVSPPALIDFECVLIRVPLS